MYHLEWLASMRRAHTNRETIKQTNKQRKINNEARHVAGATYVALIPSSNVDTAIITHPPHQPTRTHLHTHTQTSRHTQTHADAKIKLYIFCWHHFFLFRVVLKFYFIFCHFMQSSAPQQNIRASQLFRFVQESQPAISAQLSSRVVSVRTNRSLYYTYELCIQTSPLMVP